MKSNVLKSSIVASFAVFALSGCGDLFNVGGDSGGANNGLIPPSASNQPMYAPIQAPTYPPMPGYNTNPNLISKPTGGNQKINTLVVEKVEVPGLNKDNLEPKFDRDNEYIGRGGSNTIPNSPMLTPENEITLSAVGIGVSPENSLSPSQAFAMAKRAAIVDAYRQIGEKMYGIRVNAQDTVRDMMLQSSTVKTKVQALIRNAEVLETVYKDGLCQVNMELKLDGRIWHRILSNARA
ncbi:LPP20 family lipoprotein [Helicobacter japonicus]|uniref:Lipoprotein required for motility n=1 Tax=Helicobacter japonicus TaxID=425400 RepID=A0A4U8TJ33_9HELI|nr:LPP20 family lipoprotein [Helicobacter japonicus]MDE7235188.1 LPP20 family lipoprotein [Helicobacter japonicus]TLD99538.1 hypothetical protein LS65_009320 [Helicobacter japonicus]